MSDNGTPRIPPREERSQRELARAEVSPGVAIAAVVVVLAAIVGIVIWADKNNATFSGGGAVPTGQTHIVTPGTHTTALTFHWACLSKDQYTQLLGLTSDRKALESVLTAAVYAKQCRLFGAGETVSVVDTSWGDVLLQWPGEATQWWTSANAVN